MTFFLKLRHWELFLMLALPTVMCLMLGIPFKPLIVSTVGLFMMLVLFIWMLSIGIWSNRQLEPSKQRGTLLFIAGLVLPIVYLVAYIILVVPELTSGNPAKPKLWMFSLHMLSLSGIFYGFWYTAGQLKALLVSKNADYMIFSNTFFMLFIFPLGIWLIQPGVNRLYFEAQQSTDAADDA
jgi:uncharacterized membrane protein